MILANLCSLNMSQATGTIEGKAPAPLTRPGARPTPRRGAEMSDATCSFDGCERRRSARGLCSTHYNQWWRGVPLTPVAPRLDMWARVDRPSMWDCWTWTGYTEKGYGRGSHHGRRGKVHRLAYEELVGPIPDGLELDHLCRNRACCNPAHLEPVTSIENRRRGLHGDLLTHCPYGHEYTEGNTYRTPRGHRQCRVCKRRRAREAS